MVTFPDGDTTSADDLQLDLSSPTLPIGAAGELCLTNGHQVGTITDSVKFEEKRMTSASKTKVITDGFSSEQVGWFFFG